MATKKSHAVNPAIISTKRVARVNKSKSLLKKQNQTIMKSMIELDRINVLTNVLGNFKNYLEQRKRKIHLSSDAFQDNSETLIGLTIHYYRDNEYFESYDTLITQENFKILRSYYENKDELEVASLNQKFHVTLISIAKADFQNVDDINLEDISLYYLASFKCIDEFLYNNPEESKGFVITIHDLGFENSKPSLYEFSEWKESAIERSKNFKLI